MPSVPFIQDDGFAVHTVGTLENTTGDQSVLLSAASGAKQVATFQIAVCRVCLAPLPLTFRRCDAWVNALSQHAPATLRFKTGHRPRWKCQRQIEIAVPQAYFPRRGWGWGTANRIPSVPLGITTSACLWDPLQLGFVDVATFFRSVQT